MQVGEFVNRYLPGVGEPMELKISAIEHGAIFCGPWKFCASTGAEIDEELGWGPPPQMTGSFITLESHK